MKQKILALSILIAVFLIGCSNQLLTEPNKTSPEKGNVSLNFDKAAAPKEVITIKAYLTRANFDTLSGSLNLLSETSADILFSDIAVGNWHLKVDAINSDSIIIYTGETDVSVNAGIVTQVNLTLNPTGKGTGSIYIAVNWGQNLSSWFDYQYNPIFSTDNIPYYLLAVDQAQVMYDEGKFKMWFINLYNNGRGDVSYAESNNGFSWHLASNTPVLKAGDYGSWDDNSVSTGYVLKDNGIYKFYYIGTREPHTGMRQIGLATSTDGIHWQKYSEPVLKSDSEQYYIGVHSVIKIDGIYYMYYDASPEYDYSFNINLATSTDGIHWNKYGNNPILTPTKAWENGSVRYATVVKDSSGYQMIYSNGSSDDLHSAFGKAYSSDGINWTKDSRNPIFTVNDVANHWCTKISYPYFIKIGNEYRIYYSGAGPDNLYRLGVLIKR